MTRRSIQSWVLLVCSLICASLVGLSFDTVRWVLDRIVDDGSAEFFSAEVHLRFRIVVGGYGLLLFVAAVLGLKRAKSPEDVPGSSERGFQLPQFRRHFWLSVFVCMLIAAVTRLVHLNQPMRYDEAYTYNTYISRGIFAAISTYESPNNHVLNTFFSWGTTKVFGNSPASVRLPAFLAGIFCVPATMLLAHRIAGIRAAILSGFLVACSSPLIEYSTNARGYTLMSLWTILAWLGALKLIRGENQTGRRLLIASIGLGLATVPLMLLPLLMLGMWIGCLCWKSKDPTGIARRVGSCLLSGGLLAFVIYSPILIVTGPEEFFANATGRKLSPRSFTGHLSDSAEQTVALLFRNVPWPVLLLLFIGLIAFVWRLTPLFRFGRAAAISSTIACVAPFVVLNTVPVARAWLFLLPLLFVACSSGGVGILASFKSESARNGMIIALVGITVVLPFATMTVRRSIENSDETGAFPDAEQIINDLQPALQKADAVFTVGPIHPQLVYYAEKIGIDRHQFPNSEGLNITPNSVLICPRNDEESLEEFLRIHKVNKLNPIKQFEKSTVYNLHSAY